MIADEAHYGLTASDKKGGANDKYVNHPELVGNATNFVSIVVSATPYNTLSRNSKIREVYSDLFIQNNGVQEAIEELEGKI
jgi:hypothetical protein